jgi:hypothetical protein
MRGLKDNDQIHFSYGTVDLLMEKGAILKRILLVAKLIAIP